MPREISDRSRLKQKRGKIDLNHPEDYVPWIKVRDCFRGYGTRHVIQDLYYKIRYIHLMSTIELFAYYQLRSNRDVIELFEQYPLLPLSKTEELCDKYGIIHPKHPKMKKNIVMTTDFLMIVKDKEGNKKWKACAVKLSKDLKKKRTRKKLRIEQMYWESLGVEWGTISELQIDKVYVNNVILCRTGYTGIGNGTLYDIAKFLIVQGKNDVSMYSPIDLDAVVQKIKNGEIQVGRTDLFNE